MSRPTSSTNKLAGAELSLQPTHHSTASDRTLTNQISPTPAPAGKDKSGAHTMQRLPRIIKLIHSPRLLAALYGCFINGCIIASLCTVIPLFAKSTSNRTSLQAGLLFLTIAIPAFAGPLAGALADKLGARWVAVAGFLTTPSLILLRLVDHSSKDQMILLCKLLTLAGRTIILFSPLNAECSFVAEESTNQDTDMYASSFSLMNCALATAGPWTSGCRWDRGEV